MREQASNVLHGFIREVSLVLSGANPGALIDNVEIAHSDGNSVIIDDEAIIYTGLELKHDDMSEEGSEESEETDETETDEIEHADGGDVTVQDVYDTMTEDQKQVVHYMVGAALEEANATANHSDEESGLSHGEGQNEERQRMSRNVFEGQNDAASAEKHVLTHDALKGIVADAQQLGSMKAAFEGYALKHGIESIDVLFPDAKAVDNTPEFDKRRTEWVSGVLNGTRHSPFSRIKSLVADITHEDARAKGYITGSLKKEEFFGLTKRVTTPSTIYKKQKLDRDDILDITDLDVVSWLKMEMRLMLDEELARAILIGDGRDVMDEDKIKDPAGTTEGAGIRSILNDHDLYAATVTVNIGDASSSPVEIVEAIMKDMRFYKGSGSPTWYTTLGTLTSILLAKDTTGRRLWRTASDLASEIGVANIVTVEVMEDEADVLGIIVNLRDYTIGADKGGDVSFFDDFDIDYNQYKYLLETRVSGALTKIRSALVIKKTASANALVAPLALAFNKTTGVITHAAQTGVVYKRADTNAVVSANITLAAGASLTILATPASGYYFDNNVEDQWTHTRDAA